MPTRGTPHPCRTESSPFGRWGAVRELVGRRAGPYPPGRAARRWRRAARQGRRLQTKCNVLDVTGVGGPDSPAGRHSTQPAARARVCWMFAGHGGPTPCRPSDLAPCARNEVLVSNAPSDRRQEIRHIGSASHSSSEWGRALTQSSSRYGIGRTDDPSAQCQRGRSRCHNAARACATSCVVCCVQETAWFCCVKTLTFTPHNCAATLTGLQERACLGPT